MACTKRIYVCSFLVAVIAGHVLPFTAGRQLKALKNQKLNSFEDHKEQANHGKELTDSKQIPAGQKGDLQVTGHVHVSGAKEVFPPNGPNPSSDFGNSPTAYTNGFQPTTPGKSPGVGHSYVGRNDETGTPSLAHSLEGKTDDFRPTGPGRSPGVGHSFRSRAPE